MTYAATHASTSDRRDEAWQEGLPARSSNARVDVPAKEQLVAPGLADGVDEGIGAGGIGECLARFGLESA